jgi:hypothetical protein
LAVFQAESLTKLRISKLLSRKLKFWESPNIQKNSQVQQAAGGLTPRARRRIFLALS